MELTRRGYDAALISSYGINEIPEQKFSLGVISSTKALGIAENKKIADVFAHNSPTIGAYHPRKSSGIALIREDLPSRAMRAYYAASAPSGYLTGEFLSLKG